MNRKELIERLRCRRWTSRPSSPPSRTPSSSPANGGAGGEKRFRWRRLRWWWGSQTFEFLSDGKAVTFWEWEEPKP